ncbi:MAG: divalent cation tolerance protein CutA [Gemmatimonadales bacterium]|nr:divalent cation tolerance protein CutA [Gemmatimonadales bacterium]NIN48651.1 divalent cation tolerance protein CutA [Gemmatimonadales bacterium]NIP06115.1 divalent cation tolerance protein CutA [Gemmatimonadales bacterium]NIR01289.1 divalent cation tolerance protein CutA [Gemmatimonadales bacterium]
MNAPDETTYIVVLTTLPSAEEAREFVRRLLEERLIACGTVIGSATSVYRWEGAIEEASEAQVILKTRRDRWGRLQAAVRTLHPYDVPELVAVPVEIGLSAYLDWVNQETATQGRGLE